MTRDCDVRVTTRRRGGGIVAAMNSDTLIKAAAPLAGAAALIGIPADLYHFTIDGRAEASGTLAFKFHGIALIVAFSLAIVVLAGMALRMGDRLGRLGAVGVAMAFFGTVLVTGDIGSEVFWMPSLGEAMSDPTGYTLTSIIVSFAIYAIGWLLVAVAAIRSGMVATPAAALLILGAIIGFTPLPGSYIVLLLGIALTAKSLTAPALELRAAAPTPA
jgi:hypothetical protein